MVCVGRDEQYKQIWRTCTIQRPEGLTPKKEEKEVKRLADEWEERQKKEFSIDQSKTSKDKITFKEFVENRWWKDHVLDGEHTPSTISFFKYMSVDLVEYFGEKKLRQIDAEAVKRYVKYLNTEARVKKTVYKDISSETESQADGTERITWKPEKEARSYQVLRKDQESKKYYRIASTTDCFYVDTEGKNGLYLVKARLAVPGDEPYGATTRQHHFSTLRNIMEYARRFRYIDEDPCQDLTQKEKPHRDKKTIDFLAPSQAIAFLSCLEKEPLFWKCLINVLITTGLRRGEVAALQWGDIDGEKLELSITRNVTIDNKSESGLFIGKTKTGESRIVPISDRINTMLSDFKTAQATKYKVKVDDMPGDAFIFCNETDPLRPIRPDSVTKHIRKFVKANELPNVSPHDLRHTAASLALESGADLKQIQELLGHKDPSTTMKFYAGVTEEAKRRTIDGIESILNGASK